MLAELTESLNGVVVIDLTAFGGEEDGACAPGTGCPLAMSCSVCPSAQSNTSSFADSCENSRMSSSEKSGSSWGMTRRLDRSRNLGNFAAAAGTK